MRLIKLDAIDSTNDFLKQLSQTQEVTHFTVVTAKKQWKGRGQMGSTWETEEDKNLITSILSKNILKNIAQIFDLNVAVAVALYEVLNSKKIPELSIKWPNDIMSGNKKLAGILIENSLKENKTIESIIGIGLNVNQENFENLPKAASLKKITGVTYDIEELLHLLLDNLHEQLEVIKTGDTALLWKKYHNSLFKKDKPIVFENQNQHRFMGIIQKVTAHGLIEILLEDDRIQTFGIKEITMLY